MNEEMPFLDSSFDERIAKAYQDHFWQGEHVLRVDSEIAYDRLSELITNTTSKANIIVIDYANPKPLTRIVEQHRTSLRNPETVRKAVDTHELWETLEAENLSTHILLRNAYLMKVRHCRELTNIVVSINNSGALRSTWLYFPGGDWWRRPDFREESSTGGHLHYIDPFRITPFVDTNLGGDATTLAQRVHSNETIAINIHGPALSGKTRLLHALNMGKSAYVCCDRYEHAEGFTERVQKVDGDYLFLDHAERVPLGLLDEQRSQRRVCVAVSYYPLDGWSEYLSTVRYLKDVQK